MTKLTRLQQQRADANAALWLELDNKPIKRGYADMHPIGFKVITPGSADCVHFEIIREGVGKCRKCGREKDYRADGLRDSAKKHVRKYHPAINKAAPTV